MIYKSLDTIPYKLFVKIAETGDVSLLSDAEMDLDILNEIWKKLFEEHQNKNNTPEEKKVFRLSKDLSALKTQYKVILMACEALRFDWNDDLVALLQNKGYTLRNTDTTTYYEDISRIEREANAFQSKIKALEKLLPTPDENNKYSIDDVMASYSLILGFDFDYNQISYTKYYALQNQVDVKIKSLERQNNLKNGK
jgi:hypothetical protein